MLLPRITIGMTNTWQPIVNCSSSNKSNDLESWRILAFLLCLGVTFQQTGTASYTVLEISKLFKPEVVDYFGFIRRVLYTQKKTTDC